MSAAAVLSRIQAAGGEALVIDGRLKLRAARPLPDALVAEVRAHKPELLALLAANDTAPDPEPTTVCPTCGCGLYWRVSAIEPGGPGPWQCVACVDAPRDVWQDGCCILPPDPLPPGRFMPKLPQLRTQDVQVEAPARTTSPIPCDPCPDPATCALAGRCRRIIDARVTELLAEHERNPAVRITDRDKALGYFRARAAGAGG